MGNTFDKLEETTREVKKRGGSNFLFKFVVPPAMTDWLTLLLLLLEGEKFLNADPRVSRNETMKYETRKEYAVVWNARISSLDTFKSLYFLLNRFR